MLERNLKKRIKIETLIKIRKCALQGNVIENVRQNMPTRNDDGRSKQNHFNQKVREKKNS